MNQKMLKILLLIVLLHQTFTAPINPKNVIVAINCGSKDQ